MSQLPETYIVTIQSGTDKISRGFLAAGDAAARLQAADILSVESRRVGRTAVVTLTRQDGTPVSLPDSLR